jgi:hypothetical protein
MISVLRGWRGKSCTTGDAFTGTKRVFDACESSFAGCRNGDGMGWDGCYDWMRKAVHTIVVLIVNAFNRAAGVRVEEEDYWWWWWWYWGMVVVFEAKDQAERWTGSGSGSGPWQGKARFDSAVCDSAVSLRRWSGVVEWSGAMRCGAGTLQYGQMQMLRCAAQEGERLAGANSASLSLGV